MFLSPNPHGEGNPWSLHKYLKTKQSEWDTVWRGESGSWKLGREEMEVEMGMGIRMESVLHPYQNMKLETDFVCLTYTKDTTAPLSLS